MESVILIFDYRAEKEGFLHILQEIFAEDMKQDASAHYTIAPSGHHFELETDNREIRSQLPPERYVLIRKRVQNPAMVKVLYEEKEYVHKILYPFLQDILIDEGQGDLVWTRHNSHHSHNNKKEAAFGR